MNCLNIISFCQSINQLAISMPNRRHNGLINFEDFLQKGLSDTQRSQVIADLTIKVNKHKNWRKTPNLKEFAKKWITHGDESEDEINTITNYLYVGVENL